MTGDDPFDVPDVDAGDTREPSGGDGRDLHAARQAIAKLITGDIAPFVERAEADPGFPFEPEAIGALSRIARADFERLRVRLKADSQVRLPALEAAMKAAAGGTATSGGLPGRPITFHEIEFWSEPVDGAALLTEIAETIGKYVIMDPHQRDAAALGAVFAHTHDLRDTAPIFFISFADEAVRQDAARKGHQTAGPKAANGEQRHTGISGARDREASPDSSDR